MKINTHTRTHTHDFVAYWFSVLWIIQYIIQWSVVLIVHMWKSSFLLTWWGQLQWVVCVYVYMCMYVCVFVCVCVYLYMYAYMCVGGGEGGAISPRFHNLFIEMDFWYILILLCFCVPPRPKCLPTFLVPMRVSPLKSLLRRTVD